MHYVDMLCSQSDQTIMEKSCKSGSFKKHINKEFFCYISLFFYGSLFPPMNKK